MDPWKLFDVDEFEEAARDAMAAGAFDYYYGGSEREITLAENVAAFDRYRFRPRVLRTSAVIDMQTSLLGTELPLPIGLAPAALQRLAHPGGEAEVARAVAPAGILQIVATESSCSLEEIAETAPGPRWFQLYVNRDQSITQDLIQRAEGAGYGAIVLTVDLAIPGYRTREYRHNFTPPSEAGPGNFHAVDLPMTDRIAAQYGEGMDWSVIAWIREHTELPLVLKGIMTAEDAALASEYGAEAIIVSNHGGRQLDRTPATIDVLSEVVEAVEGEVEVYLDGGIRRGSDALIALALGARGVFVGRPYLWGLAAAGADGVTRVMEILRLQLENAMANLGVRNLSEVTREHLV